MFNGEQEKTRCPEGGFVHHRDLSFWAFQGNNAKQKQRMIQNIRHLIKMFDQLDAGPAGQVLCGKVISQPVMT